MTDISESAQAALDYARTWGWGPKGHFGGTPGDEAGCLITAVAKGTGDNIGWSAGYRALRHAVRNKAMELYPRPDGAPWFLMSFYDDAGTTTEMVETVLEKIAAQEGIDE